MGIKKHLHFVLQAAQVLGRWRGRVQPCAHPPILDRLAHHAVHTGGGQSTKQVRSRQPLAWNPRVQGDAILRAVGLHGQAQAVAFSRSDAQTRWRLQNNLALGHMPVTQGEHRPGLFTQGVQAQCLGMPGSPGHQTICGRPPPSLGLGPFMHRAQTLRRVLGAALHTRARQQTRQMGQAQSGQGLDKGAVLRVHQGRGNHKGMGRWHRAHCAR